MGNKDLVPSYPALYINGLTDHYYRAIDNADYEADLGRPISGWGGWMSRPKRSLKTVLPQTMEIRTG